MTAHLLLCNPAVHFFRFPYRGCCFQSIKTWGWGDGEREREVGQSVYIMGRKFSSGKNLTFVTDTIMFR